MGGLQPFQNMKKTLLQNVSFKCSSKKTEAFSFALIFLKCINNHEICFFKTSKKKREKYGLISNRLNVQSTFTQQTYSNHKSNH